MLVKNRMTQPGGIRKIELSMFHILVVLGDGSEIVYTRKATHNIDITNNDGGESDVSVSPAYTPAT